MVKRRQRDAVDVDARVLRGSTTVADRPADFSLSGYGASTKRASFGGLVRRCAAPAAPA
jgi:hypothetical protein